MLVPEFRTLEEIQNAVRPLTDEEFVENAFQKEGETNDNDTLIIRNPTSNKVVDQSAEIAGNENNDSNQGEN